MTTANLVPDLQRDEGLRTTAYPDPLSGADPWTIGYGHTGSEVKPGLVWSQSQCDAALNSDIANCCAQLDAQLSWWRTLDGLRQDVLANMCFNLGIGGLLGFQNMLAACKAGDYQTAAAEMMDSQWAKQVGARANRLSQQMATDVHQD